MNCRTCNVPLAPHELADKGEDGKGVCLGCLVKERDRLKRELETAMSLAVAWERAACDFLNASKPNPLAGVDAELKRRLFLCLDEHKTK